MSDKETFPILKSQLNNLSPACPKTISRKALNEDWALKIHGQTLEKLKQRGGLCPIEIVANIKKLPLSSFRSISYEDAEKIIIENQED